MLDRFSSSERSAVLLIEASARTRPYTRQLCHAVERYLQSRSSNVDIVTFRCNVGIFGHGEVQFWQDEVCLLKSTGCYEPNSTLAGSLPQSTHD